MKLCHYFAAKHEQETKLHVLLQQTFYTTSPRENLNCPFFKDIISGPPQKLLKQIFFNLLNFTINKKQLCRAIFLKIKVTVVVWIIFSAVTSTCFTKLKPLLHDHSSALFSSGHFSSVRFCSGVCPSLSGCDCGQPVASDVV